MNELPLRDIHLPPSISWWPLAYGWWIVIALIVFLVMAVLLIIRKRLKTTLRKEALKSIDNLEVEFYAQDNPIQTLTELSVLMRRIIISQNNSEKLAGITGMQWLELLDKRMEQPEFSQGKGQLFLAGPYRKDVDKGQVAELIKLCKKWVQKL